MVSAASTAGAQRTTPSARPRPHALLLAGLILSASLACDAPPRDGAAAATSSPAPPTAAASESPNPRSTSTPAASLTAPIRVTDGAGRVVTIARPARRVISLMPAVTEWVIALGAGDRLVARTEYDVQPELRDLPSVGGGLTPSIEWIAARRPDLVIAWPDAPSRSIVGRLEALGIAVYAAPAETIEDAVRVARELGTLLGRPEAAARAIEEVMAGLDSVRAAVAGRPSPGVLYLIGLDPLTAAGPETFVGQLVEIAGGRNVVHEAGAMWPPISLEAVVRRAPDVVLIGSVAAEEPLERLRGRAGWRRVPAVRTARVHGVDPFEINRPGPGLDEAAAALATLIHPPGAR